MHWLGGVTAGSKTYLGGVIVEEGPPAEFFTSARSDRAREFVDKIIHH